MRLISCCSGSGSGSGSGSYPADDFDYDELWQYYWNNPLAFRKLASSNYNCLAVDKLISLDVRVVKSVRLRSCGLGFNFGLGQTNDFEIGIHSFPVLRPALMGPRGEQAGLLCR